MERDAFARFKSNPEAVAAVVDEFFATADISQDGYVVRRVQKVGDEAAAGHRLLQPARAVDIGDPQIGEHLAGAEQLLDEISVRNSNAIVVELPPAEQPA